jgi:PhzF family phenazine biosynthesis protein
VSQQRRRPFRQVDVFTTTAYAGNPVAVVLDGEGLTFEQMAGFTRWTNLSEATFVLPPTCAEADYRARIFTGASTTPARAKVDWELPFAGHPTLGTCHAWLQAGGRPRQADVIVQECGAGPWRA